MNDRLHAAARIPPAAGLNDAWLGAILDLLAAHGVCRAVLCPGGRCASLILATRAHPAFVDTLVCTDERSGAFAALGIAKATGEAVLVVTTSGSAVANAVPALTEADACGTPLVILSCDRPRAMRGAGFGQMTDHAGACRAFVRAGVDLEDPHDSAAAFRAMRDALAAALARGLGGNPGPVHINVPLGGRFDATEPGPPLCAATREALGDGPGATAAAPREPGRIDALAHRLPLRPGLRGLVVAGPECALDPDTLADFCLRTGFPVIADAASGLRAPGRPDVLSGCDGLATPSAPRTQAPALVIRFGHAPVLPCVQDYLLAHPAPTLKCSPQDVQADYLHPRFESLTAPTAGELAALAERLEGGDAAWGLAWRTHAQRVRTARGAVADRLPWGELSAARQLFSHAGFDLLQLGNSMSIRHADMFDDGAARRRVLSNRGVCGIDGTVGSFLGAARSGCEAGLLVLGDLALLHDLPALATAQRHRGCACLCVIDNAGGAIFDFLPLAARADYEVAIRNPHQVDFGLVAAGFGLPHWRVEDAQGLRAALDAARRHDGASLVEVKVPAGSARAQTARLMAALAMLG